MHNWSFLMVALLKEGNFAPGVQTVRRREFSKIVSACDNPPKASATLKAFIAKGRAIVS